MWYLGSTGKISFRYISRVYQNRDNTGLSCEFEIQREGRTGSGTGWYARRYHGAQENLSRRSVTISILRGEKNAAIESRAIEKRWSRFANRRNV